MKRGQRDTPAYRKGRGAQVDTGNPFEKHSHIVLEDDLPEEDESKDKTTYLKVFPKTVVNKVTSPDLGHMLSLNPYQGCEHGCVYCYARNSHEYWGYNAASDFESIILTKDSAPEILEKKFTSRGYIPEPIMLSGNTDCYQPAERKLQITRSLLQVFLKYRHPVGIITKNALVTRDLDILEDLAAQDLVRVCLSITGTDEELRSKLEPRTSSYANRFRAIEKLSARGVPVSVMMAPVIPALNSNDIMEVAKLSANAGALGIGYIVVRLNGRIGVIFRDWLEKNFPDRADKVIHQIESMHGGSISDSTFGRRMKGDGKIASVINQQFTIAKRLYFEGRKLPEYNLSAFRKQQLSLF